MQVLVVQSCPILCDPVYYSLPDSSAHGISQARVLKWVAISSSRGSSQPRVGTRSSALQAGSLPSEPLGKPIIRGAIFQVAEKLNHETLQKSFFSKLKQKFSWTA